MERRLSNELSILHDILAYNPAQILMNSHNYDYVLKENTQKTSIKKLKDLIELRFKQEQIYYNSYNKLGAQHFVELELSGLDKEYNEITKEFNKTLNQAVDSILDLAIKERDFYYTDVYARLLSKYNNLKKKIASGKNAYTDEMNLHNYECMIQEYNNAKFNKNKLIDIHNWL